MLDNILAIPLLTLYYKYTVAYVNQDSCKEYLYQCYKLEGPDELIAVDS